MCLPTHNDLIGFFKATEPLFVVYWAVVALCLVNPRKALSMKIDFANRMIKKHGFQGQVAVTDKAVAQFRRDKWILFVLLIIVIILIQKIV